MALEQIGVEAILKNDQFQAGLKAYNDGLARMEKTTAAALKAIGVIWDETNKTYRKGGIAISESRVAEELDKLKSKFPPVAEEAKKTGDEIEKAGGKAKQSGQGIEQFGNALATVGKIAAGAFAVGIAAATVAITGLVFAGKTGLETTLAWGENLDKLGDMFGLNAKQADIWATTMDRFGVPIEEGAQQLNYFTRGLAETTKVAKDGVVSLTPFGEALKKLGISGIDPVTKKIKTFDQVMPEVLKAFEKLPAGVDASNLAMDLFGARGGSKMLDFLRDGSKAIPEITKRIEAMGGMTDDQVGGIEQFGRVWKDAQDILRRFWLQIGNALLPVIKDLTEYINKNVLPVFTKWAKDNAPKITESLKLLGKWITDTGLPVLKKLADWFFKEGIPAIQAMIKWVTNELIPALKNLWTWIDKNVLPVLVELSAWIKKEILPALKDFGSWVMQNVIPALQDMWNFIKTYILPILVSLWQIFKNDILPRLGDFVSFLRNTVFPALGELWVWFKDNILPILVSLVGYIRDNVIPAWDAFKNNLQSAVTVIQNTWNALQTLVNNMWSLAGQIASATAGIYNALVSPFQNAINWILGIDWGGIGRWIMTTLSNALSGAYGWVYDNLIAPLQNAIAWISGIDWWSIGGWIFQNIMNGLQSLAGRVADALRGPLQALLDTINGILRSLGIVVGAAPALGSALAGASPSFGGAGVASNFSQSSSVVNNFNLSVNTSSPSSRVSSDFGILRALAS
jgi:hypothetical protein